MLRKAEFVSVIGNGYPTSDGKPMAETDFHWDAMTTAALTLKRWLAGDPNQYVGSNMLMFFEEGNRRRHVSPDVFHVRGVPNHLRPNYLIWEEGRGPNVVIEITSASTRRNDLVPHRTSSL